MTHRVIDDHRVSTSIRSILEEIIAECTPDRMNFQMVLFGRAELMKLFRDQR